MPAEGVPLLPSNDLLTTPEITRLATLFVNHGVNKIRLTGGEPTLRKDLIPILSSLSSLKIDQLSMTTNGITLHRDLDAYIKAGLTHVNISLDTLSSQMFTQITRRNGLGLVQKSIKKCIDLGFPLKINVVVMPLNFDSILEFIEFTKFNQVTVRFIEYMPFPGNKWKRSKFISFDDIMMKITDRFPEVYRIKTDKHDTTLLYGIKDHVGKFGIIASMSKPFCGGCNRIRLCADGHLKNCLFQSNGEVNLRDALRDGSSDNDIIELIEKSKSGSCWNGYPVETSGWKANDSYWGMRASNPAAFIFNHSSNPIQYNTLTMQFNSSKLFQLLTSNPPRFNSIPLQSNSSIPLHLHSLKPTRFNSIPLQLHSLKTIQSNSIPLKFQSRPYSTDSNPGYTHLDNTGNASMVDISQKTMTHRSATAQGLIKFTKPLTYLSTNPKGDILTVSKVAGIQAAKNTSNVIPLCHSLHLSHISIEFKVNEFEIQVQSNVKTHYGTGCEVEAIHSVMIACLAVYDMCKSFDKGIRICDVELIEKTGGKSHVLMNKNKL